MAPKSLLVLDMANKKIRKHIDTNVAFTRKYYKVLIFMGNTSVSLRNQTHPKITGTRRCKMCLWVERISLRFFGLIKESRVKFLLKGTYFGMPVLLNHVKG